MSGFQQKVTKHAKKQDKNTFWTDKASIATRLRYDIDFKIEFKTTMNCKLRAIIKNYKQAYM